MIRFFAAGGTGVNYYMWHGGTNFGRSAMYLQTTSYDFDAPLDEYGLPTTKLAVLAAVHQALHAHADVLLEGRHATAPAADKLDAWLQRQIDDRLVNLSPGMATTVEIKTGSRTILSYLLSPLLRYRQETLRER